MKTLKNLFDRNKAWAEKVSKTEPDLFRKLSAQQSPELLWIGCADSRVPASQIVDLLPGEVFVHRNIANLVIHTDMNCLSVLQYAVDVLKVKDIVVCGHYGCGGVKAAMEDTSHGLIDNWLLNIKDIYRKYQSDVEAISDEKKKFDMMCELNVIEQVRNVCNTTIVRNAWVSGQNLSVHGWIYALEDGLLKDLNVTVGSPKELVF